MAELACLESSWTSDLRHKNPLDSDGRSAAVLARMRSDGEDCGQSICPECGEVLRLCVGDDVDPYLAHSSGEAEHRCAGSCETVWHLAAKRAVEARLPGWKSERRYSVGGRAFRADAANEKTGECIEFVHTLSKDYPAKHVATKNSGRSVLWAFDGNATFSRRIDAVGWAIGNRLLTRFNTKYAADGQLVAFGCLRKKARELVGFLGTENCFLHFHGLAFYCIACGPDAMDDEWGLCEPSHVVSRVVYGDGGLNDEIIRSRAARADVSHPGLGTNHTPDADELLDEVRRFAWLIDRRRDEQSAAVTASEKAGGKAGGRWVPSEEWPGTLVNLTTKCRCGSTFGVDVPIHGGESARRDCAKCGKFLFFKVWYGDAKDG